MPRRVCSRAAHTPIPTNDVWIAAYAMEHGAELSTLDRNSTDVPQIPVRRFEALTRPEPAST